MQKVEAFYATQYPCPDCGHTNTMRSNLEHINKGHSGSCCQCKKHWQFKEAGDALTRKFMGEGLTGMVAFMKMLRTMNSHAVDFDCDNCGRSNTILPISINATESVVASEEESPDEFQLNHHTIEEAAAHLDSHFAGYHKIVETATYEGGEDYPKQGRCEFCGEGYELIYPISESVRRWLEDQGHEVPNE